VIIAIEDGRLSFGHGKVLMMLSNEPLETQLLVADKVLEKDLSVRETEELVRRYVGPPVAKEEKAAPPKDPNVKAAETAIQRTLGCKVEIKDRGGKGKIILAYGSLEDFDRIVEVLGN
jgi:ParB family chromosome partitioning protein